MAGQERLQFGGDLIFVTPADLTGTEIGFSIPDNLVGDLNHRHDPAGGAGQEGLFNQGQFVPVNGIEGDFNEGGSDLPTS